MAQSQYLRAGHTLSVTVLEGRAHVRSADGADSAFTRTSVAFGPYLLDREFLVDGDVTVAIAPYTAALNSLIYANFGAPEDAARATLDVNPAGDDNGLTFTARAYGAEGNGITIEYVDPGADSALSVSVFRQAITVTLAYAEAAITSTAAEVLAAVNASGAASQLVTVALLESDDNFDSGAGIVTAMAATALEGGAGTAIGVVVPGGLLIDTDNGTIYTNDGTTAVPDWTAPVTLAAYAATASTVNGLAALHLYGAGAPVDYTDGDPAATGEGTAPKGAIYSDTTNGAVYRNSGTQAEPIWTALADAP